MAIGFDLQTLTLFNKTKQVKSQVFQNAVGLLRQSFHTLSSISNDKLAFNEIRTIGIEEYQCIYETWNILLH